MANVVPQDAQRVRQFSKTKLCKFELMGMCTKGTSCPFAHGQTDMRPLPDLRCTKLCASVLQTGQCTRADCTFAHSKEELRTTGAFHKTKPCRFMMTSGHCNLGARCNFAHTPSEIRGHDLVREEPATPPTPPPVPRHVQMKAYAEAVPLPPGLECWGVPRPQQEIASAPADGQWTRPSTPPRSPGLWATPLWEPAYVQVPLPGGLLVDQSEDVWKITPLPVGMPHRVHRMRSVRTSESTLCSLADNFEASQATDSHAGMPMAVAAPVRA